MNKLLAVILLMGFGLIFASVIINLPAGLGLTNKFIAWFLFITIVAIAGIVKLFKMF
jgi:hypothetical protein